jgi:hypothetical protein
MKTCSKCQTAKPPDQFFKQKRAKDGLAPWCKVCARACHRQWSAKPKNRAKHRKASKKRQTAKRKDPAYVERERRASLKRSRKNRGVVRAELSARLSKGRGKNGGNITVDELVTMWRAQDGQCALTGWSMTVNTDGLRDPHLLSLDRIDPTAPYDTGNVRLVCWCVNRALSSWGQNLFIEMLTAAVALRDAR